MKLSQGLKHEDVVKVLEQMPFVVDIRERVAALSEKVEAPSSTIGLAAAIAVASCERKRTISRRAFLGLR